MNGYYYNRRPLLIIVLIFGLFFLPQRINSQSVAVNVITESRDQQDKPCNEITNRIINDSTRPIWVLYTRLIPNTADQCEYHSQMLPSGDDTWGIPADPEAIWVQCQSGEVRCWNGIRPFKIGGTKDLTCQYLRCITVLGDGYRLNVIGVTLCSSGKYCGWIDPLDRDRENIPLWPSEWNNHAPNPWEIHYDLDNTQWTCISEDFGVCSPSRVTPNPPTSACDVPSDQFCAEYYNNSELKGSPTLSKTEAGIDQNWGSGGPDPSQVLIGNDNFSARWQGRFNFSGGNYTFTATADDGIRVYIDGNTIIDEWHAQPPTTFQRTVSLASGYHTIKAEYFEWGGGAVAQVRWERINTSTPSSLPPPQTCNAPVQVSPANGATIGSRQVTLDWNAPACSNITGYTLHVTTGAGPEDGIIFDQGVGPTEFNYTFPRDGTFYWHVAAWANAQRGPWASRRIVIATTPSCAPGDDGITLYEHADYQGRCQNFRGDEVNFGNVSGWLNDQASSLQFRGNYIGRYEVTLYKNADYNDARGPFRSDVANLSSFDINDQASSMRIRQLPCMPSADQVTLYSSTNFTGNCVTLNIGNYPDPVQFAPVGNDDARSIRVGSNVQATLYIGANFEGSSETLSSDDPDLSNNFNITINTSSVKVIQRPTPTPTSTPTPTLTPTPTPTPVPTGQCTPATNQYCVEYYNNSSLSGNPAFTATEANIEHNWGSSGPGNGIGADNFSARWQGRFSFNGGNYVFTVVGDDGIRLWVDDILIIDGWQDQPATEYQATRTLSGEHTVRVEYYEHGGGAQVSASWQPTNGDPHQPPSYWIPNQWQSASDFTVAEDVAHTGIRAARITSSTENDARWTQHVAVKVNTNYTLSGWIRTEGVRDNVVGASLGLVDDWPRTADVRGTQGWTYVTVTINSGNRTDLWIGARLGHWSNTTTGSAWFDDLELREQIPSGLGPNLLQNGSFEQLATWIPDQWQDVSSFTLVSNAVHTGTRAARILSSTENDARWTQHIPVKANTNYVLAGWIKTEGVRDNVVGASLGLVDDWTRTTDIRGTQNWTYVTVTINSGSRTDLWIGARLGHWSNTTTGTSWFDDLELREQTPNGLGPNLLQDGGFEQLRN